MRSINFVCFAAAFLSACVNAAPNWRARGDEAFRRRGEPGMAARALDAYRAAFREAPDAETAWRISAAAYYEGHRCPHTLDERKAYFAEGRDAGREGIRRNARCGPCHFWTAINMALYGEAVGPFKMIFSLSEVLNHLGAVARLDPHYASGGAARVRGMIEHGLPGVLGGSDRRARERIEEAIAIAPGDPLNYWALWRLLLDQERREEARAVVAQAMRFPIPGPDQPEAREAYTDMRDGLQRARR